MTAIPSDRIDYPFPKLLRNGRQCILGAFLDITMKMRIFIFHIYHRTSAQLTRLDHINLIFKQGVQNAVKHTYIKTKMLQIALLHDGASSENDQYR